MEAAGLRTPPPPNTGNRNDFRPAMDIRNRNRRNLTMGFTLEKLPPLFFFQKRVGGSEFRCLIVGDG